MFRYYITKIEFQPPITDPNCKISANIFIDDELVCSLPWLDRTQPLRWSRLIPCNVSPISSVVLKLCKNVRDERRSFIFPSYMVSEVNEETGEVNLESPELLWNATIYSVTPTVSEKLFPGYLDQLKNIKGVYDNLNPDVTVKFLFKTALRFASIIAEALPGPTAKMSFLIFMKTWELLEQQTQLDGIIQDILRGLNGIRDIIDSLSQTQSSMLATTIGRSKEPINKFLELLEEVSVYMFSWMTANNPGDSYDIDKYLAELGNLHQAFHASWSSSTVSCIDPNDEVGRELPSLPFQATSAMVSEPAVGLEDPYEILNLLRPMNPSGYNPDRACLDGTREAILNRIIAWTQNRDNPESFMWISGQAGMGKTSVATSLCQRLDNVQALAGCFFCLRDDSNFNDPLRLVDNLTHDIAMQCSACANEVANAIRASRRLITSHLSLRFEGLVKKPLERLKSLPIPTTLVIIIDALDECGDYNSRGMILNELYSTSRLVPWLKVIITARPESDLLDHFKSHCVHQPIVHLQTYDVSDDIRAYIQNNLGEIARTEQWPDDSISRLCKKSQGVFLWAALATKYLKESSIPALSRLQKVLEAAIKDDENETREAYNRCIGAILSISEREPLAVLDLQHLLVVAGWIKADTLERVVANLGPLILVTDGQFVRFHHSSFKDYATDPIRSRDSPIRLERLLILASTTLNQFTEWSLIVFWLKDIRRFLLSFYSTIAESTPHLYISALAFAPTNSPVAQRMRPYFPNTITVTRGGNLTWHPCVTSFQHPQSILAVSVSPSGSMLATGYPDGSTRIQDIQTGLPIGKPLIGHFTAVTCIAFSPSGKYVTTSSYDTTVRVWDLLGSLDTSYALIGHCGSVHAVAFSPNASLLASGSSDKSIRLWNIESMQPVGQPYAGHLSRVSCLTFSPDGARLASGSWDKTIRIWSVDRDGLQLTINPLLITGRFDSVTCVSFSPDGSKVASGSVDRTIRMWDIQTGSEIESHNSPAKHRNGITSISFSLNGKLVASSSLDGAVQLWDATTFAAFSQPFGHSSCVSGVAFLHDGAHVISGSTDMTIRIWDINACSKAIAIAPLIGHSNSIYSIACSGDGTRIISGSGDNTIRIWDAQNSTPIGEPLIGHSSPVCCVAFSPDGTQIVTGSDDKTVKLWDTTTHASIQSYQHDSVVRCAIFSADGALIAFGAADSKVYLWEPTEWRMVGSPLEGHSKLVLSVAFSPHGACLASSSGDHTVVLWDLQTHSRLGEPLSGHTDWVRSVAFSPCGNRIISGSVDGTARVWDVRTGNTTQILDNNSGIVTSAIFSPDGSYIALGSYDRTVKLWDTVVGSVIGQPLTGHSHRVWSLSFSPEGSYLISGSTDQTLRVWIPDVPQAISEPANNLLGIFCWPAHPSELSTHPRRPEWLTHDQQSYVLRIPTHYRQPDQFFSARTGAPSQQTLIDYSNFMHGTSWTEVACNSVSNRLG
ncbi:WD40-repeat-containing domain protein [Rhizoctonia solani]|nr:WD40-repeat-containing domain protein [Rhizoctonia solani]